MFNIAILIQLCLHVFIRILNFARCYSNFLSSSGVMYPNDATCTEPERILERINKNIFVSRLSGYTLIFFCTVEHEIKMLIMNESNLKINVLQKTG